MNSQFYSNGKLLLTAEYGVLDGALALAVPTKLGQSLEIAPIASNTLEWTSEAFNGEIWLKATFDSATFEVISSSNPELAKTLGHIFMEAGKLNPTFPILAKGKNAHSKLGFPRNWGLGSSSTLINNIAQWAQVDPYELLRRTFGGSGYDIACAQNNFPIRYSLEKGLPKVTPATFDPAFAEELYFVFLNQKRNSREAIANYRKQVSPGSISIQQLTRITERCLAASTLSQFEALMEEHETLLSAILKEPPVQERLFADYFGMVKSLGAWGGDFVLATGNKKTPDYFQSKGFHTIIPFRDMVLS